MTLVRDPLALPEAPAAGWLPGYSFFQADRVVTDQTLIDRFAKVRKGEPTPPDGGAFTPPVLWYLGRVAGIDNYLVVFRSDHVCVAQVLVQNDRGVGSRCTTPDAMDDALAPLGDPTAMVVSDAVRSVVAESADGTRTPYRVRDNFASGEPKDPPKHLVVTLADGRSRDVLADPTTPEPPGTTSAEPAIGGIAAFPGIASAPEAADGRILAFAARVVPRSVGSDPAIDALHIKQIATSDIADYYLAYGVGETACTLALFRGHEDGAINCGPFPTADRPGSLITLSAKSDDGSGDYVLLAPAGVTGVVATYPNGDTAALGFGPTTPGSPSVRDNAAVISRPGLATKVTVRRSDGTESTAPLDFK